MNSGIYVLRFPNGSYYIGKSDNIPKRWRQHWKDFQNGTHARKMQECYDRYGEPTAEVFLRCHRDHVDLYESIIIRMNLGPDCLNGAIPWEATPSEVPTLMNNPQYIEQSTADHFECMNRQKREIEGLEEEVIELELVLEDLEREGIRTPEMIQNEMDSLERGNEYLIEQLSQTKEKLETLKNLSLFDRIFNYRRYTV